MEPHLSWTNVHTWTDPTRASLPGVPKLRHSGMAGRSIGGGGRARDSTVEQNTQQSPVLGLTTVLQAGHAQKYRQASWGIGIVTSTPQAGHWITLVCGVSIPILPPDTGSTRTLGQRLTECSDPRAAVEQEETSPNSACIAAQVLRCFRRWPILTRLSCSS
jgi:hypothetical protein